MDKKPFFPVILVMVLVCGMVVAGCDDGSNNGNYSGNGSPNLNGTWVKGDYAIVITGSNYTVLYLGENSSKGNFSIIGTTSGTITFYGTDDYYEGAWHPYTSSGGTSGTWSLSGNTFTIGGLSLGAWNGNWIKQ